MPMHTNQGRQNWLQNGQTSHNIREKKNEKKNVKKNKNNEKAFQLQFSS